MIFGLHDGNLFCEMEMSNEGRADNGGSKRGFEAATPATTRRLTWHVQSRRIYFWAFSTPLHNRRRSAQKRRQLDIMRLLESLQEYVYSSDGSYHLVDSSAGANCTSSRMHPPSTAAKPWKVQPKTFSPVASGCFCQVRVWLQVFPSAQLHPPL